MGIPIIKPIIVKEIIKPKTIINIPETKVQKLIAVPAPMNRDKSSQFKSFLFAKRHCVVPRLDESHKFIYKKNSSENKIKMKIFTNKNAGLILATLGSAVIGSMIQIVTNDTKIRLWIFIGAIIAVIIGTAFYEKD